MAEIILGEWQGEPNASGLRTVRLVALDDVLELIRPRTGTTIGLGNLVLATTAELATIRTAPQTAQLFFTEQDNPHGSIWAATVALEIPKLRTEVLDWLADRAGRRWVVLAEDMNGNRWLVGDPLTRGCRLLVGGQSGQRSSDKNVTRLLLESNQWQSPYGLTDFAWTDFHPANAEFDLSFTLDFTS